MKSFNLAQAVQTIAGGLEDMLVRGAYLAHHAETLRRQREALTARIGTLRSTQPPFLFLRPKETRASFKNAAEETRGNLESVDQALALSERLSAHLRACTEEMLEKWLRVNCDDYRGRLELIYAIECGVHLLSRLEKQAQALQQALRAAHKRAGADAAAGREALSTEARAGLEAARTAAVAVESAVAALNENAARLDAAARRLGGEKPPLVQPPANEPYAEILTQLAGCRPENADKRLSEMTRVADHLAGHELPAVHKVLKDLLHRQNGRAAAGVREAWSQLHAHALEHSVETRHVHEVVSQTERIYHLKA